MTLPGCGTQCPEGIRFRGRERPVEMNSPAPRRDPSITHQQELEARIQALEAIVADRGSGIPESDRERVFDRFERLESHRASPGTGLGLSLARAIVLRHQGRITLLDNAPGLRVRVTFRTP